MLRLNQIKIPIKVDKDEYGAEIRERISTLCKIKATDINEINIIRRSIDARKKPELFYIFLVDFSVKNEKELLKRGKSNKFLANNLTISPNKKYIFPLKSNTNKKVVVIGSGPAGLFCSLFLARNGYKPLLLERGDDVDSRTQKVESFWNGGKLDANTNVQFGEGGAGTFSDGKLNSLIKDVFGLNRVVLETFYEHGARKEILYDAKPHVGTDILKNVVKNIRNEIISLGGEVRFNTLFNDFEIENNKLKSINILNLKTNENEKIDCDALVLAIGHSARDTFDMIYEKGIVMEQKPFAVGLRVQHKQSLINESQYGMKEPGALGASPYKVTAKTTSGRGVFSFCMCPGGYVVNSSSEEGYLAVNGMSYSDRAGENANSAIIVSVSPSDFPSSHPLAGVTFQRDMEEKAFNIGNGKIPIERYGDFRNTILDINDKKSVNKDSNLTPQIKGEYEWCDLSQVMPKVINEAFVEGMEHFGHIIKGFSDDEAILAGVESRTSSPVRIVRDSDLLSNIEGIFPCGEGAGYAGGIMSAAVDGIKIAEAVAKYFD